MRFKIFFIPILFLILTSCGNSKKEFQKVYDYYSEPEDSLKLKAAEFLIKNIEKHQYLVLKNQEKYDSFFKKIGKEVSVPDKGSFRLQKRLKRIMVDDLVSIGLADGSLPEPKYVRRTDEETISAEFLIENIEYAFKAWEFPWARDYSFNDFCKYILPYRYGSEPLESTRKEIFENYKWIADSLKNATVLEAAALINKQFESDFIDSKALAKSRIRLKISNQLDLGIFVDCFEEAGLGVSVLRSLGIPAIVARIPNWGNRNNGHDIAAILNLNQEWTSFTFGEEEFKQYSINEEKIYAPKMFFRGYDKLEDASNKLMNTVDLEVNVNAESNDDIYLYVFSNLRWIPLFKGKNMNSSVIFEKIGNNSEFMFLAGVKTKDSFKPISQVFHSDSLGNITYLKPDKTAKFSASLNRKYRGLKKGESRLKDLIGGTFSIADTKSFENKKQLYKVDTILEYRNNIIKVSEQTGKYVRYDFPQSLEPDFNGPAEISFYTSKNGKLEQIKGNYFGPEQLSKEHIEMMTDNNLLSYVRVWDWFEDLEIETGEYIFRKDKKPIWLGMEMDSITTVTHIGICPRNDQNGVYPGINYELFYWDDSWVSLGKKQATSHTITYDNIPENALLWLRNLDEGKEERIFTLKDGEQIWW